MAVTAERASCGAGLVFWFVIGLAFGAVQIAITIAAPAHSFHPMEGVLLALSVSLILYGTIRWLSEVF